MGLIKKQINEDALTDFFKRSYEITFEENTNGSNIEKLNKLREVLPVLNNVDQEDFNENLVALTIATLDISWDRYIALKPHDIVDTIQAKMRVDERVREDLPVVLDIDYLIDQYSRAFGESGTSGYPGNALMAELFLENVFANKYESFVNDDLPGMTEAVNTMGYLIGQVFDQCKTMIKSQKLLN